MGYKGQTARLLFDSAGFQHGRDTETLIPLALVEPTSNINFHEAGIGKRGGTSLYLASALTGNPAIRGLFDFRKQSGTQLLVFADANGKVYYNNEANVIKTGMSTSNYFSFSVFGDELYICDGSTVPQTWNGVAGTTSSITGVATDWATVGYPFQAIPHARGSNGRMWYLTRTAVYASKNNDGKDVSDAQLKKIPVYSDSGLVGGFDFGGTLFVYSKTRMYVIDDTSVDTADWGYNEVQWEGGASHWRLVTKAGNNMYLMTDEGLVYSLRGVQATGDWEQVNLAKPAHIDRWIREKVTRSNVEAFHCIFDRNLRAITFFLQVGGTNTNTGLKYFIDRPPEIAWIPHSNTENASGFNASVSAEVKTATGDYRIYTGDFSGKIWRLEQSTRSDNEQAYESSVKLKPMNMGNPRMYKHFRSGRIRAKATGNFTLTVRVWVDGERKNDISLSLSGSGATFGTATFNTSVFSDDSIVPVAFSFGYYGFDIQIEIVNNVVDEDFFLSELLIDYKDLGTKT